MATTAKYTDNHDRLTLVVKFADGSQFRLGCSRTRDSCSTTVLDSSAAFKIVAGYAMKPISKAESHGERFLRLKAWFEQHDSLAAAARAVSRR